jgi:hypothetical protein
VRAPDVQPASGGVASPGFALPAALFALLVIAALAAGAYFAALQEMRLGRNSRRAEVAFGAAEAGLSRALAEGLAGGWSALRVGDSAAFSGTLPAGTGGFAATALRVNGRIFLFRSTGSDATGESRRSVATLARLAVPEGRLSGALAVRGAVEIGGSSFLDGRDAVPPGWADCPAAGRDTVAGLTLPTLADLRTGPGCTGLSCIAGAPPVREATAADDSALLRIGNMDWHSLAHRAGTVYPGDGGGALVTPGPAGADSACDRSVPGNWGEPGRPPAVAGCGGYFPVILANGDLTIAGGRGQGVLLVAGDLTIAGGAEFDGPVLVRGSLQASGAGGRLYGGVVVVNEGGGTAAHLEGVSITYSSCALAAALGSVAPVRTLRERAWADLY